MIDEVVPAGKRLLEESAVGVGKRSELQVPLEGVVAIDERRRARDLLGRLHHVGVFEAVAQAKRTVVVEVIPQPHVRRRCLLHDSRERRMRIERSHHRQPSRVARAEHADTPVVPGHILEEPFDRVVGIGTFVDGLRVLAVARLTEHHEGPFGLEPPADVLQDDDVAVGEEIPERGGDAGRRVLADAIRRSREEDRQLACLILWRVHLGVQPNAVAHRDHVLGAYERRSRWRLGRLARSGCDNHDSRDGDESK